jgi:hypothetical protein
MQEYSNVIMQPRINADNRSNLTVAGRPRTISEKAKPTSISFTPAERMAIHVISENRKAREEKKTTASEIVVDAVWYLLEQVEHKTREQIEALLPPAPPKEDKPLPKVAEMRRSKKER